MSESIIATQSSHCKRGHRQNNDHIFINGKTIDFAEILNTEFFKQSKLNELETTFKNNTPFPYVIFDGLFSFKLLELMNAEFNLLKNKDWRLHIFRG